ncbi:hypothetical protein R9X49_22360 [Pectobacterium carotovorum]|uniref:hypothetical protein n=1 Tax=Pectobacterium carotovorum TaxID=554 RepID=UPI0029D99E51|nr:hypothetical protein [Pectobacterium carotovorum]MDX6917844.1 hypothetical protein [Pectobacterium carotovorum]
MQHHERSIITPTVVYVKLMAEECQTPRKQVRFIRDEIAPSELDPKMLDRGDDIARRCSKGQPVRIPAMQMSELGHVLRSLELKRACA